MQVAAIAASEFYDAIHAYENGASDTIVGCSGVGANLVAAAKSYRCSQLPCRCNDRGSTSPKLPSIPLRRGSL